MGTMIRVFCAHCEFSREAFVGFGMEGDGAELCSCYRCKRLVQKKVKLNPSEDNPSFKCPYCRKKIEPVTAGDPCPMCGDALDYQFIGLWD